MKVNGGSHVTIIRTGLVGKGSNVFSGRQTFMSESDGTGTEYPPLSDVLANHLTGCEQCRESLNKKPVGLGQTPTLCSEWFAIIADWAEFEGEVNNVVAHDEYGNQARYGDSPLYHAQYRRRIK